MTARARTRELVGQAIGGYRVVARIGKGGMGEVYLGVHPTLGKRVAIKVLSEEIAHDDDMRRRFFDEARAAAALDSPHIVQILDLAQLPDGSSYMTMEFLEGESLERLLGRTGKLGEGAAAAIAVQALEGLAAAHAEGIVHRDLKPANLFLAQTRRGPIVKLLDFGLAKLMGRLPAGGATQSGTILGTPEYMAPEQAAAGGAAIDARADVYAFGALLYEMLAGRPPFTSDNWGELLVMHQTAAAPALPGVTPALQAVVTRALAKAPRERFADAAELRRALLGALGGEAALPPLPVPERAVDAEALAAAAPSVQGTTIRPTRGLPARALVPLLTGALGVAVLAFWLTRQHAPRAAAPTPGAPAAAPAAADQTCRFTLTDEAGKAHDYGGPRVRQAASSEHEANMYTTGDGLSHGIIVGCTPAYGESGFLYFGVTIPPGALVPGSHALPEGALMVDFNAALPDGFSERTYRGGGTLELLEYGRKQGTRIRGSFTGKAAASGGKSIGVSGRFDFKL